MSAGPNTEAPAERDGASESSRPWPLRSLNLFHAAFVVYVVAGLLAMTFVIPPFQKSDEPSHYYRTVSLSNFDLVCTREPDGEYYFYMKRRYAELPAIINTWEVAMRGDQRYDRDWLRADFSRPELNDERRVGDICNLPPIGYLPNALGVLLGKPFENPLPGFYMGRLAGAIFFLGGLLYALAITPARYRLAVYFYGGLPIVLHQVAAISYDAVQLALFPVMFGYIAKFASEPGQIERKHLVLFLAALLVSISIRSMSYVPLLGLFFAIAPMKMAPDRAAYAKVAGIFFGVTTVVTLIFSAIYLPRVGSVPDVDGEVSAQRQLDHVLGDPWGFIEASYKTVENQGEWLLKQTIGVYGWIDAPMPFFPYYLTLFVLGLVFYHVVREDRKILNGWQVAALFGVVAATIATLFLSLYLVWTPVGQDEVLGLQGRYFIGLLPFTMLAVSQLALMAGRRAFVIAMAIVLLCIMFYNMVSAIDLRYYG